MELRSGYRVTDAGMIPNDWEVSYLKDLVVVKNGFAFSSANFSDSGQILLTPGNFRLNGGLYFNERNTKRYRGPCPPSMTLNNGDLVIVMTDLTLSCDLLGKPAFVQTPEPILHNQRIGKITAVSNRISLNYLYHFFLSEAHAERMKATATGSTVRHTSNSSIYSSLIALPSRKAEQEAIAEALSDADALIESLDQLIANKHDIKKAAMQQLLTGEQRLPGFCGEREVKRLGEIARLYQPVTISADIFTSNGYPVYGANGVVGFYSDFNHDTWQVTITCRGSTCGTVNRTVDRCWITGNAMVVNCDGNKQMDKTFLPLRCFVWVVLI